CRSRRYSPDGRRRQTVRASPACGRRRGTDVVPIRPRARRKTPSGFSLADGASAMALARTSTVARRRVGRRIPKRVQRAALSVLSPLVTASIVRLGSYQVFVLPSPGVVWNRARELLADGTLVTNGWATLREAGIGFAIAFAIALPLGYV